jgi:hypothetical protein
VHCISYACKDRGWQRDFSQESRREQAMSYMLGAAADDVGLVIRLFLKVS